MMKSATMSPRSSGARALPAALSFEGAELAIIDRDGRPWVAAADLARALGYARSDKVTQIYERHAGEFSEAMTQTPKLRVPGNPMEIPVRIFSPRGCHLVAMFARTERAAAFRRWVLDVLEQYETPPAAPSAIEPECMPGFGETELHSAAFDLIQECPSLLLRGLKLVVSWDGDGLQSVQFVPKDAVVLPRSELAAYVGDPFGPALVDLPGIIEAAAKRLGSSVCLPALSRKEVRRG